jgi:hypothetical protein
MEYSNLRTVQKLHEKHGLNKPSVTRLLVHVFSSIFSSEMLLVLILGSTSIAFISDYIIPTSDSYALLIGTIIVLGFLRGCKTWQEDLNDYQKSLADARRTTLHTRDRAI